MLKFIFDLPPCFQGHKFTCYKIIILLFFRIYIKFLKKYNQNEDIFRNSSAFVIRKAALTCLARLRRIFAHIPALSPSELKRADPYASINQPVPVLTAELLHLYLCIFQQYYCIFMHSLCILCILFFL